MNVRYYSTLNYGKEGEEFMEWLGGFIDSEGCFYIEATNKGRSYRFNFQITLHIDDIGTLYFINRKLGIGKVIARGTKAVFTIRAQQDIVKINLSKIKLKKISRFFVF